MSPESHFATPPDAEASSVTPVVAPMCATDHVAQTRRLRDRLWRAKLGESETERRIAALETALAPPDEGSALELAMSQTNVEGSRAQLALSRETSAVSELKVQELEAAVEVLQDHIRHLGRQIDLAYADNQALRNSRAMRLGSAVRRVVHPFRAMNGVRASSAPAVVVPPMQNSQDQERDPSSNVPIHTADLASLYLTATSPGNPWWFPALGAGDVITRGDSDSLVAQLNSARTRRDQPQPDVAAFRELLKARDCWEPTLRAAVAEAEAAALLTPRRSTDSTVCGDIVVDVRCLQDPRFRTRGVGRHSLGVLTVLRSALVETRLVGLLDPDLPPLARDVEQLLDATASRTQNLRLATVGGFVQLSPMTADVGPVAPLLASDHIHCIAVIYDFIPHENPVAYLRSESTRLSYAARLLALSRYDVGIAISAATTSDAVSCLGWIPERLVVSGIADPLGELVVNESSISHVGGFALAPTGGDARKNLLAAVAGFAVCKGLGHPELRLIIVGQLGADLSRELETFAERASLPPDDITVLAGISDSALADLYASASVVVVPSFCEGFSLPVAEAVLRGAPVVASDVPAHRELLGDGWWLVPATGIEALGLAMERAISAPGDMVAEQRRSLSDLATPTAVDARLRAVFETFEGVVAHSATPALLRSARPRLAILSPYPPQKSGVADYTAFTVRHLAKTADVTVFSEAYDGKSPRGVDMQPLSARPYLDRTFDGVLSVIGNSHFHVPMIEYLQQFGGACLAHDNRMLELYAWWKGNDETARLLSREKRTISGSEIPGFLADLDTLPDLAFGDLARWADPLIVHAHSLAARLGEEHGVTPLVVPFVPYNLPTSLDGASRERARRRVGLTEGRCHVATFGEVDVRTKGADLVVAAAAWCRTWGVDLELHFVGSVSDAIRLQLLGVAREVGMEERLRLHGRVDPETMAAMLTGVDVAVQLRTSTMLSLSGALADCIAYGIPTVATVDLAIEMSAPSFVRTVSSKATPLIIAEAMTLALDDAGPDRNEHERTSYLNERSGEVYAAGLLAAVGLGPVQ